MQTPRAQKNGCDYGSIKLCNHVQQSFVISPHVRVSNLTAYKSVNTWCSQRLSPSIRSNANDIRAILNIYAFINRMHIAFDEENSTSKHSPPYFPTPSHDLLHSASKTVRFYIEPLASLLGLRTGLVFLCVG